MPKQVSKSRDGILCRIRDAFHVFARQTAKVVGSPWVFAAALLVIVVWAATGPIFKFSDSWQLIINTGTTIITFLMVFIIQNTQNRDSQAMHLKLDELIRVLRGARNDLVDLERMSDEELQELEKEFERLGKRKHDRESRSRSSNSSQKS